MRRGEALARVVDALRTMDGPDRKSNIATEVIKNMEDYVIHK
jgi:hypothetical protein